MKLIQRIGYYLGGFSIGLVILAFFLSGKNVSCDYGPEARVLKNINSKKLEYNTTIANQLQEKAIDSSTIKNIIKLGNIQFSKSDTRKEPCGIYFLEGKTEKLHMDLKIENCDSIATITEIIWK
ncbi:hypothetical protein ACW5R3_07780 [Bizionia sp. KMM 8389]